MSGKWFNRIVQTAALALTMAAICQELDKPKEEREWHGKIGSIPYDFRLPTIERLEATYWNPADSRLFTPEAFGIGWAINFYTLLERLRVFGQSYTSEEDYLMPSQAMKDLLVQPPAAE